MELILVQITDIHIKDEKDHNILESRSEYIVNAINKHIIDEKETLLFICITGDIAYAGKKEQYLYANIFFSDIIKSIKKRFGDLFIQLVSVPGNHDCDFDRDDCIVRESLLKDVKLDMSNVSVMKTCTTVQEHYFNFVNEWDTNLAPLLSVSNERIFTINDINYMGTSIKFHCLNTAWCSTKNEKPKEMKIYIPELEDKSEKDIVITLMHHEESWLTWESAEVWKEYYKHYADIVLVGHDHTSEIVCKDNYGAATNYFVKGNQLYGAENSNQSGFNILKIDLDTDIERFYSYEWKGTLYENVLDTKARQFKRNRYIKNGAELKQEVLKYLEDNEIDLVSKYKDTLKLSDVFVYPTLIRKTIHNKKNNGNKVFYREKDEIIDIIQNKKYIMIFGEKEYGKTALLKKLYKEFFEMKFYPVLIEIEVLNTGDGDELNKKIAELYMKQYTNLGEEFISQMEPDKKVCLIDNFENIMASDKKIKKILNYLTCKFGTVVLTSNLQSDLFNFLRNIETKEYIENKFTKLYIQDLKNYMKRNLASKWLLLSNEEQDPDSPAFDVLLKNKLDQVQSVMKKGFFNKTPIEFLLILSYLDNYEKMNTDYSRYSYIYECLILDKINEISNNVTNEATMYKTILEQLAFKVYDENQGQDMEESFVLEVIFDYNQEYRGSKGNGIYIIDNLKETKILEKKDKKYRFKYSYMYYYFTGSYILKQLPPEEKQKQVKIIFSDLSKEINFNIALFLAYDMNAEFEILPQIKEVCQTLLPEYKEFQFAQQKDLLKKLEYDIDRKIDLIFNIPKNADIPQIQERRAIEQDELDEVNSNKEEIGNFNEVEKAKELEQMTDQFNKTLRIIEFLGDILKNYSSSIRRNPRIEIINLMFESNMKLMGAVYGSFSDIIDTIIEIVDKKIKEEKDDIIAKSEYKQSINEYLSRLWVTFVSLSVSHMGYSLQSDRIVGEIIDVGSEKKCTFNRLVSIDYLIRIDNGHLPVKAIEDCVKGKEKLDGFSVNLLSGHVASYLRNFQYNSNEKKAVCSLLKFNIKDIFIEEQKNKSIFDV